MQMPSKLNVHITPLARRLASPLAMRAESLSTARVHDFVQEDLYAALDWSAKQGRILTGGGVAEPLYTAARGYAFEQAQLPHHHLEAGSTHDTFRAWRWGPPRDASGGGGGPALPWLTGGWSRPLFAGGGEESSDASEACVNLVTPSLFVDIRIPIARNALLDALGASEWDTGRS